MRFSFDLVSFRPHSAPFGFIRKQGAAKRKTPATPFWSETRRFAGKNTGTLMKNTVVGKRVLALIAGISAALLAVGYGTGRLEAGPSPDVPENQSSTSGDADAADPFNERVIYSSSEYEIKFLGIDPSRSMGEYIDEKYPAMQNYTDVDEESFNKSETADLCDGIYTMRREKLMEEYGADGIAYGTADGRFIFVANMGKRGAYAITFDVGESPTETAGKFRSGLDELIKQLDAVETWSITLSSEEAESIEEAVKEGIKKREEAAKKGSRKRLEGEIVRPLTWEETKRLNRALKEELQRRREGEEGSSPPLLTLFVLLSAAYLLKGAVSFLIREMKEQ
ncbi:MAG: hypothetical protein II807_06460 [Thermoguttaceae bacterium]|nr:hypothetical protein [Thermoguttaceae bacterium]